MSVVAKSLLVNGPDAVAEVFLITASASESGDWLNTLPSRKRVCGIF